MPTRIRGFLAMLALAIIAACSNDAGRPPGAVALPDILLSGVPNLSQSGGGFDEELYAPEQLCAPVAVSNSLRWLTLHNPEESPFALVNRLASPRYMITSPSVGTGPAGVTRGVRRYLQERDVRFASVGYFGLRDVSDQYRVDGELTLQWLHSGLNPDSAVWVNFGWYETLRPGIYRRKGGHWMTLVGYSGGDLVFHDPADGSVAKLSVSLRPWGLLHLEGWGLYRNLLEVPANEAHRGDYALIDGAVRLELAPEYRRGP